MSETHSTMELVLAILIITGFLCSSSKAHTFDVGGEDGWTLHPSHNYTLWAEKYRFEINDQLVFKYKQGHDTVLVVNRNDYTKCNKENPIRTFKGGHSVFKFKKSGPFYFISGHDQNCEKGQKLEVIVLSKNHHFPTTSPEAGPTAHAPTVEPPSRSPSPSPTAGKTPSPASKPPSRSPSPSPAVGINTTRISPVKPPARSPSPSPAAGINPTRISPVEPPSRSPSPSPAAGINPTRISPVEPPSRSPSPSPAAGINPTRISPVEPPSRSPSPSPAARINPTRTSPVEPPSRSRSTPPAAKAPAHEQPSRTPSPSPAAGKPVESPTHSPSQEAESPKKSYGAPEPVTEHPHHGHRGLHFGLRPIFLFGY